MAFATTDDGVRLHYEETGSGSPIIFVHEFAGDHRSREQQLQHFGRRHRAIYVPIGSGQPLKERGLEDGFGPARDAEERLI